MVQQQSFSDFAIRMDGAKEVDGITILDQQAGEILDFKCIQQVSMVFNVNPDEIDIGILAGECFKGFRPVPAGTTPLRTETGHCPC